jgi:hypothetical protein
MAKDKICIGCIHNNNGWCRARKTNQGIKDLVECNLKKTDNLVTLEEFIKQKKFELQVDNNSYNRGVITGLEIALAIIKS